MGVHVWTIAGKSIEWCVINSEKAMMGRVTNAIVEIGIYEYIYLVTTLLCLCGPPVRASWSGLSTSLCVFRHSRDGREPGAKWIKLCWLCVCGCVHVDASLWPKQRERPCYPSLSSYLAIPETWIRHSHVKLVSNIFLAQFSLACLLRFSCYIRHIKEFQIIYFSKVF